MPETSDKKKKTTSSKRDRRQAKKSDLSSSLKIMINKFNKAVPNFPTDRGELQYGQCGWARCIKGRFKTLLTEFNKKLDEEIKGRFFFIVVV